MEWACSIPRPVSLSAVLSMRNPVQKHCADTAEYNAYANVLTSLMATLGEGYAIHKQDVFTRKRYQERTTASVSISLIATSAISRDVSTPTAPLF